MISSADEEDSDSLSEPVAKKRDIVERRCESAETKDSCERLKRNKEKPSYACRHEGKKVSLLLVCLANPVEKCILCSVKVLLCA